MIGRLIKNGKINLDGTLPEYEKEAMIFKRYEIIEKWEKETGLDIIEVLENYDIRKLIGKN